MKRRWSKRGWRAWLGCAAPDRYNGGVQGARELSQALPVLAVAHARKGQWPLQPHPD